jgi:secreted trypsin-like serine protease
MPRFMRKLTVALAGTFAALALSASPSMAVVGGSNAGPNEFPSISEVIIAKGFLCTGTLIAPDTVLTAGHCGSITGGAGVASPAAYPPQLIDVYIGSNKPGQGEKVPVSQVVMNPNYMLSDGYDISILKLSRASTKTPTPVSGATEESLWAPSTLETIAGFGATEEGGDLPDTLQKAQVPITTDATCASAYPSSFEAQTQICAGYPQGGVDTCQGDSGGPMFGRNAAGALRVVGATSYGEGCARPNKPGVYARVGDDTLREWIRQQAPNGVG